MHRFLFTGVSALDTALTQIDHLSHVVSIGAPGSAVPERVLAWARHSDNHLLRLEFDDLGLDWLRREGALRKMLVADGDPIVLFSEDHARQLIAFGAQTSGPILVHCAAGLSRSPACAFALAAAAFGPGRENEAANAIARWPAGNGFPNTLVVHVADEVLGREGALREAWTRKWYDREIYDWSVADRLHQAGEDLKQG